MIYTLHYQSESLLKKSFFELRKIINSTEDIIQLYVDHSHLNDESPTEIYKIMLKLEGSYRAKYNAWTEPVAKVRVMHQNNISEQ